MATVAKFNQPLPTTAASFVDQAGSHLRNFGDHILESLVNLGEMSTAAKKARQYQALNALTDDELEIRGLRRDELVTYVFGTFHG
ncbi:MAG: hypothetical protein AAF479_13100 [Pseudomonadota bacterium]